MKKLTLLCLVVFFLQQIPAFAQPCTPLGNPLTYGTGNVWKGYLYSNQNLTTYCGYINQGIAASPDFDQDFGGSNTMFATNGCAVQTETFSARYRLTKTFSSGTYDFVVGGDDGYRLSLDGGATWAIDSWVDHSYETTTYSIALNGTYDLVLDYFENGGDNRVTFSVTLSCVGTENTSIYGTGNVWKGYVYDNADFTSYKGMITQGAASNPDFDTDFGSSNSYFTTSGCSVQTETFSVRYRLRKPFNGIYLFTVAADDGYRLSLDGGLTWIINKWSVQSLLTTVLTLTLSGNYNMVLEYYENSGENRVKFDAIPLIVLPINLLSFTGKEQDGKGLFDWQTSTGSDPGTYELQKSNDGNSFKSIGLIPGNSGQSIPGATAYQYTDATLTNGKSYYRLKITDASGHITYSNIVVLNIAGRTSNEIRIYPTLITERKLFIQSSLQLANARLNILDISGKKVSPTQQVHVDPGQTVSISLPQGIQAGMYIVQIERPGHVFVQKLLVK